MGGPSLRKPTPEFLAALPTDPADLLARLTAAAREDGGGPWSADRAVVDLLAELLYRTEPLIPPRGRAAILRALALLPSIGSTGQEIPVDGRPVCAISQSELRQRQELLLDARTGRVVGRRTGEGGQYELWSFAVVDRPGATP
jgi:hypothetical protein